MIYKAKDIAQMLGVSTATVSLIINNKPGVSEQKHRLVMDKIHELGCEYLLKEAPALKGNVGFVVYKTNGKIIDESPYFVYLLEGLNQRVTAAGYTMRTIYLNSRMSEESQKAELLKDGSCGFLIFATEMERQNLQVFIDLGLPFVALDNSFIESDVDVVAINNQQGVSKAMHYLYDMGHREIGYIRCDCRIQSLMEREEAYYRCLRELDLPIRQENICRVGCSIVEIYRAVDEYIAQGHKMPTAFFGDYDHVACSAMRAFQERGFHVPEDISFVGFDDRPICQFSNPTMTTINVPRDAFAQCGVERFLQKLEESRETSLKILVGTQLVVRESVQRLL